jgi:hypothetical protein
MKKIVAFVLLFAAALAASAQSAPYEPLWNYQYDCSYSNYSGPATHPYGWSNWVIRVRSNPSLIWAYENFQVPYLNGVDNHSVAWAKPDTSNADFTVWEFTDGAVQCKNTQVYRGRYFIYFQGCNDGHSRFCQLH